jgi:predicted AAA+ superfamily ATPase
MTPRDFIDVLDAYHELYPEIKRPIIMLYEVQAVPDWERIVRYLLDEGHTVYVTGSSSKLLSREVATHLRGRSLTYTLFPSPSGSSSTLRASAMGAETSTGITQK